jgi:hypothetical protein
MSRIFSTNSVMHFERILKAFPKVEEEGTVAVNDAYDQ